MMNTTRFTRKARPSALRIAGTVLAVVLLIVLLEQQGWGSIRSAISRVPLWRFVLALGLTIGSRFAVAGRWHVLLRSAGLEVSFWQSLRITFAGLFASNFLPTTVGGDVIRLGGALRLGWDRAVCIASLIVDRLVGMAGMAMAALLLLVGFPGVLSQLGADHSAGVMLNLRNALMAGLGLAHVGIKREYSIRQVLQSFYQELVQALSLWLGRPRSLLLALAFTWAHMLFLFASIELLLPGLGESMPFWLIAGLWSLTYFVTLLPVSINGLGVQEISMNFLFTTLGGISVPAGLTLALLMRVLPMLASLPGAAFIPGMLEGEERKDA